MTTHLLEVSDVVVKRFRPYDRGEHRREVCACSTGTPPASLPDRWPRTSPPIRPR